MRKLTVGVLAIIMVLAIAGAASAHDNWTPISPAENAIMAAGWEFLWHRDAQDVANVPVVLRNGQMVLTNVHQYTVWFVRTDPALTPNRVEATFEENNFNGLNFTSGNVIAITVTYVQVNDQPVRVEMVTVFGQTWAREIQ